MWIILWDKYNHLYTRSVSMGKYRRLYNGKRKAVQMMCSCSWREPNQSSWQMNKNAPYLLNIQWIQAALRASSSLHEDVYVFEIGDLSDMDWHANYCSRIYLIDLLQWRLMWTTVFKYTIHCRLVIIGPYARVRITTIDATNRRIAEIKPVETDLWRRTRTGAQAFIFVKGNFWAVSKTTALSRPISRDICCLLLSLCCSLVDSLSHPILFW